MIFKMGEGDPCCLSEKKLMVPKIKRWEVVKNNIVHLQTDFFFTTHASLFSYTTTPNSSPKRGRHVPALDE